MSNDSTSVLFEHTARYYQNLKEEANTESLHGVKVLVFRGSVVRVFRGLGVSQSYYSKIRKSLIEMGCLTVLQQGGRSTDSVVVLHRDPTAEDWENLSDGALTSNLDVAILGQRLNDVTELIGGINVKSAIADLALRIEGLEREVERIGRTPTARRKSSS
jgi:hypothetical protein